MRYADVTNSLSSDIHSTSMQTALPGKVYLFSVISLTLINKTWTLNSEKELEA